MIEDQTTETGPVVERPSHVKERMLLDGRARMIRGDVLEVLPDFGTMVDAVITDPPYSSGGMVRGDRMQSTRTKYQSSDVDEEHPDFTGDNRDQRAFTLWSSMWLMHLMNWTKPGGIVCMFSDWRQLPSVTDALQVAGWVWRGIVPWDKVNARPMPNRFRAQCEFIVWATNGPRSFDTEGAVYHPGILREKPPGKDERVHSTQKPVGICEVLAQVAPRDGLILDPFSGSGTTGVAALQQGRRFIGIEKMDHNFEICCERLEQVHEQIGLGLSNPEVD